MRAYKVSMSLEGAEITGFAGTQKDATTARQTLVDKYGVKKSSVTIEDVDIPTDKTGLLDFLNTLVGAK